MKGIIYEMEGYLVNSPIITAMSDSTDTSFFRNFPGKHSPYTAIQAIILILVLGSIIICTVIGNILVCIAVALVRKLRKPCNYLLVSLAMSDLCVSILVMPTALVYQISGTWPFGSLMCDLWVSFDVLSCTASILNLCMISVDRYWAITKPLTYMMKRTPRRMIFYICLVWLGAACISLPPLMIMGNEYTDSKNGPTRCSVSQNFFYQIYATLGSFYIPLAVMIKVYYQIFCAARNIVMEEIRAQLHLHGHCRFNVEPSISQPTASILNRQASPIKHRSSSASTTCSQVQCFVDAPRKSNESQCPMLQRVEKPILSTSKKMTTTFIRNSTCSVTNSPQQKKLRLLVKERKASTTLGIIMGVFVCCWLPFFILALVRPFIHNYSYYIPEFLSDLFLWLGYCNSLLNPIIYAILNKDFRRPFREILFCRCGNLNHVMREEFYQSQYGDPSHNYQIKGNICSSGVVGGIGNIAKSSEDAEHFGDINESIIDSVDIAGVRNESFL